MLATKILIHPSVSDFLEELPNILITEGYLNIYENAELLVDEIIDFIQEIPTAVHYHLSPSAESHFSVTEKIYNTLFSKEASHLVQHGISFSLNKTNVFWLSI